MRVILMLMGLIAAGCSASVGQDATSERATIRIFDADEPVQSRKRGICANKLHPEDFVALAPGVSWYYNWHFKGPQPHEGIDIEFIPMVWGDTPERFAGLKDYLAQGHRPRVIFSSNEPNLKGQAFIPPEQTASHHKRVMEIAAPLGIDVIGPHMSIGSAPNASIKAFDPIQQKEITYTYMVPFLKAFFHFMGEQASDVPATAFHSYKNVGEMKWAINMMHNTFNRPVWVTEYAQWSAPDVETALDYLVKTTDLLERTDFVHGYAWFKERHKPTLRLFEQAPGELSKLGKTYVHMPVHDADVYYRPTGPLDAGRYVWMSGLEISLKAGTYNDFEMSSQTEGAWISYNFHLEQAGRYQINLIGRSLERAKLKVGESAVEAMTNLPAGPLTVTVHALPSQAMLDAIELVRQ